MSRSASMSVARLTMSDVAKFTLSRVGSIVLERHPTFGASAHLHWGGSRRGAGRATPNWTAPRCRHHWVLPGGYCSRPTISDRRLADAPAGSLEHGVRGAMERKTLLTITFDKRRSTCPLLSTCIHGRRLSTHTLTQWATELQIRHKRLSDLWVISCTNDCLFNGVQLTVHRRN